MEKQPRPLSVQFFRLVLHEYARWTAVGAAVALVWLLLSRAYPWWIWLPACFLAGVLTLWLALMLMYAYQKATYPHRAAAYRRRVRQRRERGED